MATTHPLPPHRARSQPRPLSVSEALSNIQAYLAASATQPHLHPDCTFSERIGPTLAGNAATGGVVMHQLRRLEAGLRGEWLGLAPEVDAFVIASGGEGVGKDFTEVETQGDSAGGGLPESNDARLDATIARMHGVKEAPENARGRRQSGADLPEGVDDQGEMDGGIADLPDYQQQLRGADSGILEGDIGSRGNVVGNIDRVPNVRVTSAKSASGKTTNGKVKREERGSKTEMSTEDRKAAKKARQKKEKEERAKNRENTKQKITDIENLEEDVEMVDTVQSPNDDSFAAQRSANKDDEAMRKAQKRARKLVKAQKKSISTG